MACVERSHGFGRLLRDVAQSAARSPVGAGGHEHLWCEVDRSPASERIPRQEPATDRYPTTVDGRHPWSAHIHSPRSAASVMPGRVRPEDRTSSAFAAHRSLAACADSRSPCTVRDRYRDRPLTGSGPTATRTSHTPLTSLPHRPATARISHERNRTNHDRHADRSQQGSTAALNGMVNGMRSCTKITRNS